MAIQVIQPNNENLLTCKNCGSTDVVRFGSYKGHQRYFCKACKRKFKADNSLFHMKVSPEYISSALNMYYSGMSINDVCNHLQQENGYHPSKSVVFNWIIKYTDIAVENFKDYHPDVGDTWIADETVLNIDGKDVWMYDIIDEKTRFLLATRIAFSRTTNDAERVMRKAEKKAGRKPSIVITDSNSSYIRGIKNAFGYTTVHIKSKPFTKENNTNMIERWHETLKERTKIMKGLKDANSAVRFTDGFLVHYNYFRPHESLNSRTPAQEAEIDYTVNNWKALCHLPVSKETEKESHKTIIIKPPKVNLLDLHIGVKKDPSKTKVFVTLPRC